MHAVARSQISTARRGFATSARMLREPPPPQSVGFSNPSPLLSERKAAKAVCKPALLGASGLGSSVVFLPGFMEVLQTSRGLVAKTMKNSMPPKNGGLSLQA
ncbi:hypothetical protein T439DRAFT_327052 [Meredithblackwellia eburnea MCA 4105]